MVRLLVRNMFLIIGIFSIAEAVVQPGSQMLLAMLGGVGVGVYTGLGEGR